MPYRATRMLRRVEGKGPYAAGDLIDADNFREDVTKNRLVRRGQIEFVSDEQVEAEGITPPVWANEPVPEEPTEEPEEQEDEKFECPEEDCDKSYDTEGWLTRHFESTGHGPSEDE